MKTAILKMTTFSHMPTSSLWVLIPKKHGNRFPLVAPVSRAWGRLAAAGFPRTPATRGKEAAHGGEEWVMPPAGAGQQTEPGALLEPAEATSCLF